MIEKNEKSELLNEEEVTIIRKLIQIIESDSYKDIEDKEKTKITYTALSNELKKDNVQIHREQFSKPFDKIEDITNQLGLPYITSVVISETTIEPGRGFSKVLERHNKISKLMSKEERKKIIKDETIKGQKHKDWSKLEKYIYENYGRY